MFELVQKFNSLNQFPKNLGRNKDKYLILFQSSNFLAMKFLK